MSGRLDWLIEQNARIAPLVDTSRKLAPLVLAAGVLITPVLWAFFSAYLGELGQPALSMEQAAQWLFLLVFSLGAAGVFAVLILLPAVWVRSLRLQDDLTSPDRFQRECFGVAVTSLLGVTITIGVEISFSIAAPWLLIAIMATITLAGMVGGFVGNAPETRTVKAFAARSLIDCGYALVL